LVELIPPALLGFLPTLQRGPPLGIGRIGQLHAAADLPDTVGFFNLALCRRALH
jgi:hypothetical protein